MSPSFPSTRLRRLRNAPWIRDLVQETRLHPTDFILPLFIVDGSNVQEAITSMPGVFRYSIDLMLKRVAEAASLKIPAVALFPKTSPEKKNDQGSEALNPDNLVCRAVKEIKHAFPNIGVMCDVALDPYTSHGHDGLLVNGKIVNDLTLEILAKQALLQAKAGCDILGPSDMMDGRVGVIRKVLEKEGFHDTLILSYAAKFASAFYGPFRDAIGSTVTLKGDKKTYQQNPANGDEALREAEMDIAEGADILMVKPALPYLDVIYRIKEAFKVPTFAYHVSGEYSMIHAAGRQGWVNTEQCMLESLMAIKRAGASGILTYAALDVAKKL